MQLLHANYLSLKIIAQSTTLAFQKEKQFLFIQDYTKQ